MGGGRAQVYEEEEPGVGKEKGRSMQEGLCSTKQKGRSVQEAQRKVMQAAGATAGPPAGKGTAPSVFY